jgi:tryptophan synthase beta subunit
MQPKIPLPEIDRELQELIYSEMKQQVKLSEKQLPSIGAINILNSNR